MERSSQDLYTIPIDILNELLYERDNILKIPRIGTRLRKISRILGLKYKDINELIKSQEEFRLGKKIRERGLDSTELLVNMAAALSLPIELFIDGIEIEGIGHTPIYNLIPKVKQKELLEIRDFDKRLKSIASHIGLNYEEIKEFAGMKYILLDPRYRKRIHSIPVICKAAYMLNVPPSFLIRGVTIRCEAQPEF